MPFPANWLEELIVEWLDLEGFASTTKIKVPAGPGGAWAPDVTGAKLIQGQLVIRHCEGAMHLIENPEKQAARYKAKYSDAIEDAVRKHFSLIFGASAALEAKYEKWVICCQVSVPGKTVMKEKIPEVQLYQLREFVFREVLPSIERWREPPNTKKTTLPADKWLLSLIDSFKQFKLMQPD
jgi:hypothetical protein